MSISVYGEVSFEVVFIATSGALCIISISGISVDDVAGVCGGAVAVDVVVAVDVAGSVVDACREAIFVSTGGGSGGRQRRGLLAN